MGDHCQWDTDTSECVAVSQTLSPAIDATVGPSIGPTVGCATLSPITNATLSPTISPIASPVEKCSDQLNKKRCSKVDHCQWDTDTSECVAVSQTLSPAIDATVGPSIGLTVGSAT